MSHKPIAVVLEGHSSSNAMLEIVHAMTGQSVLISKDSENWDVHSSICVVDGKIGCTTRLRTAEGIVSEYRAEPFYEPAAKAASEAAKRCYYLLSSRHLGKTLPWGTLTGIRPAGIVRKYAGDTDAALAIKFMQEQYFVSEEKARLATETYQNQRPIIERFKENEVCVYIGIPFCPTRCLYCSFISVSTPKMLKLIEPYTACLLKEIALAGQMLLEKGRKGCAVYIGGGTPTILPPHLLSQLLSACNAAFGPVKEFTVEAGRPDTLCEEKIKIMLDSGVTRTSINPQTLNDSVLETIGRKHTAKDFDKAYNMAISLGMTNINTDVIAALPGESTQMFVHSLERLLRYNPASVTLHTMCEKRGSTLRTDAEHQIQQAANQAIEMVSIGQKMIMRSGQKPYYMYRQKDTAGNLENVGFSKAGAHCLYNVAMMEDVATVVALGAGAVSKIVDRKTGRIQRMANTKDAVDYIRDFDKIMQKKKEWAVG